MTNSLRDTVTELAAKFADEILQALRSASLEELLSESRGRSVETRSARRGGGRASESMARGGAESTTRRGRGRRVRRTAEDLEGIVTRIVDLLRKNPDGLRAEQIREELGLEAKEMPRPLAQGLAAKQLRKQGQKRSTTYFAR